MIAVERPMHRWILITSAKRKQTDCYDIQYENIPHFCFSCGRLGHSDIFCPTPGTHDENGALPFKPSLRAPEDRKRTTSGEYTAKEKQDQSNSTRESRSASTKNSKGTEVTSPVKHAHLNKRKGVPQNSQVYRQVTLPALAITEKGEAPMEQDEGPESEPVSEQGTGNVQEVYPERIPKKKKPTPPPSESSAPAASQPCQSQ
ncbi:hypothetical protein D1007_38457 [Hordeum vulgare]|nr:hypothetical protein D1007_38457 [Hordeum vulgare]